jgi:hypothetical protein
MARIIGRPIRLIGICSVCAENDSGLIPIVTEETATSQISKPINSEQVSFSGQVLEDNELAAVSGSDMELSTESQKLPFLTSAMDNVIKSIGEGLKSVASKG